MAWSVYDINFVAVPLDGAVFGLNCYASLSFEDTRIHYALFNDLIIPEESGCLKYTVDEGSLPMIYMGYDRYISYF